jgi:nemo like kinase
MENRITSSEKVAVEINGATATSQPVGHGAFGVVWCVSDGASGTSRKFAVKKLMNCVESLHSAQRAYCELKALTCLKHDNILSANCFVLSPCHDSFTDVCVISDLMETDLHRIIASGQVLCKSHIQLFIYQILRGLKYLHSTKIVHCDIKPGNILVNSNCRLKIGDFGLACSETATDSSLTTASETRTACGTLSYVAPELLLGVPAISSAADMWSTGCLLVEMLTRRVLFQAASTTQQLDLMLEVTGNPRGIEDFRDAAPAQRHYLMQKMSSRNCMSMKPLLDSMLHTVDHTVKHLLTRLLLFSPRQRLTASQALSHAYVSPGQRLYHSSLCQCCDHTQAQHPCNDAATSATSKPSSHMTGPAIVADSSNRLEPVCDTLVSLHDSLSMKSTGDIKAKIQELHLKILQNDQASEYQLHMDAIV